MLVHSHTIAPTEGLVLEFGVAEGTTIRYLAGAPAMFNRVIYGFDSFRGLPEAWATYPAGHFACKIPEVPNNVELIVGMFAQTLPRFLKAHRGACALVHIDCDLYSSTKTVLDLLAPRIVAGTVMVLDEYWIVIDKEQRAFNEWMAATGRTCCPEARSVEQLCAVMVEGKAGPVFDAGPRRSRFTGGWERSTSTLSTRR